MSMTATTMKGTQLMAVPIRCRQCLRCSRFKAHDARTLGGVAALSTSAASHKRAQASPLRGPSVSQRIRSQLQQRHPQKQEEPVHQRQPQSKSTQSDSASTSSVERETKVLTLPFSFTTEYARDFAEKMAIPLIYFRGRFFQSALYILSLVFRKVFGRSQRADRIEANVKLKRLSKVYLPYWIVDASVSTRCNGPDGEAETSLHTQGLQLPAHDWAPIRTVPVRIPRDHERTFEAFDRTKHLSSTVESGDEAAEMLPFAVSPLELPRYLASRPEDKEAIATIDGEEVSFKLDTLQTDLLAAYPVLLPFHLALYHCIEEGSAHRQVTMAMPAWRFEPSSCLVKETSDTDVSESEWAALADSRRSPLCVSLFDICSLSAYPRLPIAATRPRTVPEGESRQDRYERETAKIKEEMQRKGIEDDYDNFDEYGKAYRGIKQRLAEEDNESLRRKTEDEMQSRQQAILQVLACFTVEAQARWLKTLIWSRLQEMQAESVKDRPATVETSAGLGAAIDWDSPQIMRLGSIQCNENRLYLAEKIHFDGLRLRVASTEASVEEGQESLWGNVKSAADHMSEAHFRMKQKVPQWLKAMREETRQKRESDRASPTKRV